MLSSVDNKDQLTDNTVRPLWDNSALSGKCRHLTRLTILVNQAESSYRLPATHAAISGFDILAVRPDGDEKAFQAVCKDALCDVISLDFSSRSSFYLKLTTTNLAISRGLFFEVTYSGCIRDSSIRRNIITNTIQLLRVTRGKNLIISSEVQSLLELRSPYDIIHMASLFGMNQAAARAAVADNPRKVLHHAEARNNTYQTVVSSVAAKDQVQWVAEALSETSKRKRSNENDDSEQ